MLAVINSWMKEPTVFHEITTGIIPAQADSPTYAGSPTDAYLTWCRDYIFPKLQSGQIAVLITLLTYADWQTGEAYPAVRTIAEKLGMSAGHCSRLLRQVEQEGVVRRVRKMGLVTVWGFVGYDRHVLPRATPTEYVPVLGPAAVAVLLDETVPVREPVVLFGQVVIATVVQVYGYVADVAPARHEQAREQEPELKLQTLVTPMALPVPSVPADHLMSVQEIGYLSGGDDPADALIMAGIDTRKVAVSLVVEYGEPAVRRVLAALPCAMRRAAARGKKIENPGGWVRNGLRLRWTFNGGPQRGSGSTISVKAAREPSPVPTSRRTAPVTGYDPVVQRQGASVIAAALRAVRSAA